MDFRRRAIELYNQGKSIGEISQEVGINLDEDMVKRWSKEGELKSYKSIIFKIDKEQRYEKDIDKRRLLLLTLKERLEGVLEILPNDLEMRTKLMYVYIGLNDIEGARNIAYGLLDKTQSRDVLNGLSIIEEKSGNYNQSIEYIDKILEKEPYNQALKKKKERIQNKKNNKNFREITPIERMYREIATLERSIKKIAEERQGENVINGNEFNQNKTLQETYVSTYKKIKEIANKILLENPEEVIAKQKLVKALFVTGEIEEAEQNANELISVYGKDEIALWFLSKIEREKGNLEKEKEYLETILSNSPEGTQIKVQQRLERVKHLLENQKEEEQLKKGLEENYTEETRQEFIEQARRDFIYGNLGLTEIEQLIQEARKYPNFVKSLIVLLDIKSKITDNKQDKIDELENYIDDEFSVTPEEYDNILNEIAQTRKEIEEDNMIEQYLDREKKEEVKRQREYSKYVIERLGKGEIKRDDLPEIVSQLEKFKDRTRAIFLITKLYEILYDKEKAHNELIKYTYIADLTKEEQEGIPKMQKLLTEGKKAETINKKNNQPESQDVDEAR